MLKCEQYLFAVFFLLNDTIHVRLRRVLCRLVTKGNWCSIIFGNVCVSIKCAWVKVNQMLLLRT